jgi:hypothetical protein
MGMYTVNRRYFSRRDGINFGPYAEGDVVELDPADAEWLNRDSPGVVTEVAKPKAERAPERQAAPAPNRQHKGGRNRAGA